MTARSDVVVVAISQGPTPYYTPILNAVSELVHVSHRPGRSSILGSPAGPPWQRAITAAEACAARSADSNS